VTFLHGLGFVQRTIGSIAEQAQVHVQLFLVQSHVSGLRHRPLLHSVLLLHRAHPRSWAAAASSLPKALSTPPTLKPPSRRVRRRREWAVPKVLVRASKRASSIVAFHIRIECTDRGDFTPQFITWRE